MTPSLLAGPFHVEESQKGQGLPILCTSRRLVTGASFGGTARGNLEQIFEQKSGDLRRILTEGGLSRRSICRTLMKSCYQHPWFSILS